MGSVLRGFNPMVTGKYNTEICTSDMSSYLYRFENIINTPKHINVLLKRHKMEDCIKLS